MSHGTATSTDIYSAYISFGVSTPLHIFSVTVHSTSISFHKFQYSNYFHSSVDFVSYRNISPTDSYLMGFFGFGEGWHNYHVSNFVPLF